MLKTVGWFTERHIMPDTKHHGFLFKAEMILAILADLKSQTRRAVTANNSLIDGTGKGIRAHWKHLDWNNALASVGNGQYWRVKCRSTECMVGAYHVVSPRVQAGDSIYAKETWKPCMESYRSYIEFRAGPPNKEILDRDVMADLKKLSLRFPGARKDRNSDAWKSPLHMPRWAARIVRPVIDVRAERLQDISEPDAMAEGCPKEYLLGFNWFRPLWNSINGERPGLAWKDNPAIWVYEWGPAE